MLPSGDGLQEALDPRHRIQPYFLQEDAWPGTISEVDPTGLLVTSTKSR